MNNRNEIRNDNLRQIVGGRVPNSGKKLNVLVASRWLLEFEYFCQLSLEDQAALSLHATDELWLETFLYNGAKAGIDIFIQAIKAGKGIS